MYKSSEVTLNISAVEAQRCKLCTTVLLARQETCHSLQDWLQINIKIAISELEIRRCRKTRTRFAAMFKPPICRECHRRIAELLSRLFQSPSKDQIRSNLITISSVKAWTGVTGLDSAEWPIYCLFPRPRMAEHFFWSLLPFKIYSEDLKL